MQASNETISAWRDSAPYWEKYREKIRQMFAPVTDALVADARIGRGAAVLDIATGPGEPALSIAAIVGPEGRVLGVDPVEEMVEVARRSADRYGVANAKFEIAAPESLPWAADTFDAVTCRFGVMFFSSPVAGVREFLRVLKPERKLALAVWSLAERNPFFHTVGRVVERYVELPPIAPDAPDAFRFGAPGKLRGVLTEAGAADIAEHVLAFNIEAPVSVEEFWTLRCEMSEKMRGVVESLSPQRLAQVKAEALEALRPYSTDRGMSFSSEVLIVSGVKR
jgi:SAM-dependent methyltransferase